MSWDNYKRTEINGQKFYGKHLMVTAESCNENVLDIESISEFVRELVDRIDMVAYGDIVIDRFGDGDEIGISAVQLIMTSAITIHTNDRARDMYLDVFSCKWFDETDVLSVVEEYFAPDDIRDTTILRR